MLKQKIYTLVKENPKAVKWIKIGTVICIVSLLSSSIYIAYSFTDQVASLKRRFVKTTIVNGKAQYKIVKKRPDSWVYYRFISKDLVNAIVVSEDWAFFGHKGIDFNQIQIAIEQWIAKKRGLRGASTITQQLAKNLFLSSERSLMRKLKELVLSMMLERYLTKAKILEIYLNIIEYGEELYGIQNAAYYYFRKYPNSLTPRESAFLAMLLPSPKRYSQSFRDKKLTPFAEKIMGSILHKMVRANYLTEIQQDYAMSTRFFWEPIVYETETLYDSEEEEPMEEPSTTEELNENEEKMSEALDDDKNEIEVLDM